MIPGLKILAMSDGYAPHPRRLLIVSLIALVGLCLAGYLTWEFHAARASQALEAGCDLNATFSCSDVARTSYAEVLPGLPVATLAGMFFAAVLGTAALARRPALARAGARALQLQGLLGLATSLLYLYFMHFRIGKYCLFCLGVDATNLALFVTVAGLCPGWRGRDGFAPWLRIIASGLFVSAAAWGGLSLLKKPAERAALAARPAPVNCERNPLTGECLAPAASAPAPGAASPASGPAPLIPPGLLPASLPEAVRAEAEKNLVAALTGPVVAVADGPEFPSEGPADARVTVVEFADFQCPHCARAFALVKRLRALHGDAVRVVYRQFPLSKKCNPLLKDWGKSAPAGGKADFHEYACEEARLALCAQAQGRYLDAAGALFAGIEKVEKAGAPAELLGPLGFDGGKLFACAKSPEIAARVARDAQEGTRLGLHGTPAFYVNGRPLTELPPELLDFVVGRALAQPASPSSPPAPGS